jgi:hypothetical protein
MPVAEKERNEEIFQLYAQFLWRIEELAEKFDVSRSRIYAILVRERNSRLPKWTKWAEMKANELGHCLKPWKMPKDWTEECRTTCKNCGYKAKITNGLRIMGDATKKECPKPQPCGSTKVKEKK